MVSKFNYSKIHAWSTSMLISIHYCCCIPHLSQCGEDVAKREVGGHALKVREITLLIMENHGQIMEVCF